MASRIERNNELIKKTATSVIKTSNNKALTSLRGFKRLKIEGSLSFV